MDGRKPIQINNLLDVCMFSCNYPEPEARWIIVFFALDNYPVTIKSHRKFNDRDGLQVRR